METSVITKKFKLLTDLGSVVVPDDYDFVSYMSGFQSKNAKKFYFLNRAVTERSFPLASNQLIPGSSVSVRVFEAKGNASSDEKLAFLASQNALRVGVPGIILVHEQKKDQLLRNKWLCSFDVKERLWKDTNGNYRVPYLDRRQDGVYGFDFIRYDTNLNADLCLLCFTQE